MVSDNNLRLFEDELLAEVLASLERAERSSLGWPAGRHVVSVSRRGSGREAELVVDFADIVDDELEYLRKCFPMHAYRTPNGERLPVSVIASIVRVNLEEPVRPSLP